MNPNPACQMISTRRHTLLAMLFGVLLVPLSGMAADSATGKPVTCRTIGPDTYQSFVARWDTAKSPVLCALIRTPKEWDAQFHPAAVMGTKKPFGPEAKVFERELLLVVARSMKAPKDSEMGKVFMVEKVTASDTVLTLQYRFTEPKQPQSFEINNYIGVFVPKKDYQKVVFIENGKTVGEVAVSKD